LRKKSQSEVGFMRDGDQFLEREESKSFETNLEREGWKTNEDFGTKIP
jgi:hypothetical protein